MENEPNESKQIPLSCLAALHRRKYNREYYHEHKTPVKCEYCGNEYSCKSGLVKHQKRSQQCMVNKLQKYISDMEGKSHFGIPEKELFTNYITKLETI